MLIYNLNVRLIMIATIRNSRMEIHSAARKATVPIRTYVLKVKSRWTIRVIVAMNAAHHVALRIVVPYHFNATKLAQKTLTVLQRGLIRVLVAAARAIAALYKYAMVTKSLVTIVISVVSARVDFAANRIDAFNRKNFMIKKINLTEEDH